MNANTAPPLPATSKQAVWSLIFGILSITCLWIAGSIPAIVLGALAIQKTDRSGGAIRGRGLGIAGIITGAGGVILGITPLAIIASLLMPVYAAKSQAAKSDQLARHILSLVLACKSHASDYGGKFPPDLASLIEDNYLDDDRLLHWPAIAESEGERQALLYSPGHSDGSTPNDQPLIAAPKPLNGKRVIGFVGGNVQTVSESEFQEKYGHHFL